MGEEKVKALLQESLAVATKTESIHAVKAYPGSLQPL
jgi:hypothetical protein